MEQIQIMSDQQQSTNEPTLSNAAKIFACAVIFAGGVLELAGIDLVLPSVPDFPAIFDATTATTQLVLAAFVGGKPEFFIDFVHFNEKGHAKVAKVIAEEMDKIWSDHEADHGF